VSRLPPLVALAVLGACAALAAPAGASCAPAVRWHGTLYLAAPEGLQAPRAGRALRGGVIPGCNDVVVEIDGGGQAPREPDRPVRLRRVRGIAPAVAVRGPGGALLVSVACSDTLAERPARRLPPRCGL
jgi:hypothetical protein